MEPQELSGGVPTAQLWLCNSPHCSQQVSYIYWHTTIMCRRLRIENNYIYNNIELYTAQIYLLVVDTLMSKFVIDKFNSVKFDQIVH